jgi:signal peptidase I
VGDRTIVSDDVPVEAPPAPRRQRSSAFSWFVTVAIAVLVAVVVRAFLFQMFWIPSVSMAPTLEKGDRVIVSKIGDVSNPGRGDILVFSRPPDLPTGEDHLIKRVVGMPGDRVAFAEGDVYINEQLLPEPYLPAGTETLQLKDPGCRLEAPCVIGPHQYWMMGDNRDESADSRRFGPIEADTIVGRAFVTVWPLSRIGGL